MPIILPTQETERGGGKRRTGGGEEGFIATPPLKIAVFRNLNDEY
jgi:hypothetical protein